MFQPAKPMGTHLGVRWCRSAPATWNGTAITTRSRSAFQTCWRATVAFVTIILLGMRPRLLRTRCTGNDTCGGISRSKLTSQLSRAEESGAAKLLDLRGPPGRCSGCWPHDGEVAGGAVADFVLVISGSRRRPRRSQVRGQLRHDPIATAG